MANSYGVPNPKRRGPRAPQSVMVSSRMTLDVRAKLEHMADALGVSMSALISELIEREEVDENGHPGWDSKYRRTDDEAASQQPLELSA